MAHDPRRTALPVLNYSSLAEERQREKEREYDRRLAKRQIGCSFFEVNWHMALVKLIIFVVLLLLQFLIFR